MKIIKIDKSYEVCAEAGWYGYDIYLDKEIDENFILSLGKLGKLTFLKVLKEPFFKIQNNQLIMKGVLGHDYLRIGIEGNDQLILNKAITAIDIMFQY